MYIGQIFNIQWTSLDLLDPDGNSLPVKIELSRDNGASWATLVASTPDDGSYLWTVTGPTTSQGIIRISDAADPTVYADSAVFDIFATVDAGSWRPGQARGPYTGVPL